MNLIDRLEAEHHRAVAALEALHEATEAALTATDPSSRWREGIDGALEVVCAIVHAHAEAEEVLLFPALQGGDAQTLLATLIEEHAEVRQLYDQVRTGLDRWLLSPKAEAAERWIAPARALRGRLSTHMQRENLLIFPRARRLPAAVVAGWEGR